MCSPDPLVPVRECLIQQLVQMRTPVSIRIDDRSSRNGAAGIAAVANHLRSYGYLFVTTSIEAVEPVLAVTDSR